MKLDLSKIGPNSLRQLKDASQRGRDETREYLKLLKTKAPSAEATEHIRFVEMLFNNWDKVLWSAPSNEAAVQMQIDARTSINFSQLAGGVDVSVPIDFDSADSVACLSFLSSHQ